MKGSCTSLRKRVGDVFSHEAKARNLSQEAFADHDVLRRAQNGFVEEGGGGGSGSPPWHARRRPIMPLAIVPAAAALVNLPGWIPLGRALTKE